MSKRLRIFSFIAAIGCFALSAGAYQLGFDLWPPSATLADGTTTRFRSADVEACLKGRTMAWLGDRSNDLYWHNCQRQLSQYRALNGFEIRFWMVISFGLLGIAALLMFALGLRFDSPLLKVLRGARLQAGSRGLKAFAQACAAECRIHGEGISLVPTVPLSREREARHFLILGSVGGGKTQTMLHWRGDHSRGRCAGARYQGRHDGWPSGRGRTSAGCTPRQTVAGLGYRGRLQHQAGCPRTRRPLYSPKLRSNVVGGCTGDFRRLHRLPAGDQVTQLGLERS